MSEERRQTQTGGKDAVDGWIAGDLALSVGPPKSPSPDGFEWRRLTDLARLESGHTPSRNNSEYWDEGDIPWITVKEAAAHHGETIFETEEYITALGEQNSSARLLPANTVCLTRTGSLGFVVVMGRPMTTSQGLVNWVCGPDLDWRYLKYILLGESDSYHRFSWGSAHQTIYFPEVKAFHVLVPRIEVQLRIADVLGALDDKIESNRRMQSLLLATANVLVDRALQEASEDVKVEDLVTFLNYKRKPLSSLERSTMEKRFPYYGATGVFDFVESFLFDEVCVLVGEDGSVVNEDGTPVTQMAWGKYWVNNHAHVLVGKSVSTELAFLLLSRVDVRPIVTGAVQLKINMRNLKSLALSVPPAIHRDPLEKDIQRLLECWRAKDSESRLLTSLRDTLLPELLSGRLRVKDAEKVVEGAV